MDKIKHFLVGLFFGVIIYITDCFVLGLIASLLIFIGKEIYDKYKINSTGFDLYDLLADLTGLIVGFLICLLFTL